MTDITPYFPTTSKVTEPRLTQIELFDEITVYFESGSKQITVCAPTGSGKSPFAVALARYFTNQGKTALITSPLNELVDQYDRDFEEDYLCTIKGRKHYACTADYTRSCAEGYCQEKTCSVNPGSPRYCMDTATTNLCTKDIREQCGCLSCIYKSKMKAYKKSNIGNTNFTLFMKGVTNDPDIIIIDECDTAEDFVRLQHTISVPEIIDWEDFEDHIISLEDWKQHYLKIVNELKDALDRTTDSAHRLRLVKDIKRSERRCSNIKRIIDDFIEHGEPWAVTNDLYVGSTKYEPITTGRFLEPLLKNKYVVLMSATPQDMPGYDYIEVDSPFPVDIRQWKYNPLGPMSLKHRERTIPKLAKFLCDLEGKTLVHCISYATAESIGRALQGICGGVPLIQIGKEKEFEYKDGHGLVTRKDAVTKFKQSKDPNQILLSVKMDRGVDFPESDITNNVIGVMPWPNPTDPLTIAKDKLLGKECRNEQMANTIMQSYGRINRNTDKTTMTYIIDSNWGTWFKKNKDCFKEWFLEAQLR